MHQAGDHFLAGSSLADEEHGAIGRSDELHLRQHIAERAPLSDRRAQYVRITYFCSQIAKLRCAVDAAPATAVAVALDPAPPSRTTARCGSPGPLVPRSLAAWRYPPHLA